MPSEGHSSLFRLDLALVRGQSRAMSVKDGLGRQFPPLLGLRMVRLPHFLMLSTDL
jgi:hypothetical protein